MWVKLWIIQSKFHLLDGVHELFIREHAVNKAGSIAAYFPAPSENPRELLGLLRAKKIPASAIVETFTN